MNQTTEQVIEAELQAKGLTAPRLRPSDIDEVIKASTYTNLPDGRTVVCQLTLRNGFTVIGTSACVSPENFDQVIGNKLAYEKARNEVWGFEAYLLKEKLYKPGTPKERVAVERDELKQRARDLEKFLEAGQPSFISDEHWLLMDNQLETMMRYIGLLELRYETM